MKIYLTSHVSQFYENKLLMYMCICITSKSHLQLMMLEQLESLKKLIYVSAWNASNQTNKKQNSKNKSHAKKCFDMLSLLPEFFHMGMSTELLRSLRKLHREIGLIFRTRYQYGTNY